MNKKEDNKAVPSFPEPFEYLNEELASDLKRFHELEDMRKALNRNESKPKDFRPSFNPPEYGQGGPSNNHNLNSLKVEAELQKLDLSLTQQIETVIKKLQPDKDLSNKLRETLVERKYPNPFRDKSPKEIERFRATNKDIETSAQFMLEERRRNREKDNLKQSQIKDEIKTELNQVSVNGNTVSMSTRFTQSLSYTKAKEIPPTKETLKDKVRDFIKNKDLTIEPE